MIKNFGGKVRRTLKNFKNGNTLFLHNTVQHCGTSVWNAVQNMMVPLVLRSDHYYSKHL